MNIYSGNKVLKEYIDNSLEVAKFPNAMLFLHDKHTNPHPIILDSIKKLLISFNDNYSKYDFSSFEALKYSEITYVLPVNKTLDVESVIFAIKKISKTAISKKHPKIMYIQNIDFGNRNSLNPLLKFLEELSQNTYIIMSAFNKNNVLYTIRSRVQLLRINHQEKKHFKKILDGSELDSTLKKFALKTYDNIKEVEKLNKPENINLIKDTVCFLNNAFKNKKNILNDILSLLKKENSSLFLHIVREYFSEIWLDTYIDIKALRITKNANEYYNSYSENFFPLISLIDEYKDRFSKYFSFELQKNAFILEIVKIYGN